MNIPDERLNNALNALCEYLQGTAQDLAALREASHHSGQRLSQLTAEAETLRQELQGIRRNAAELDTLRQELQGIRQNNSELERSLRIQLATAREQVETHTRELAALTERAQQHSQEVSEHIQTLTGLHQQEQSQRESALAMLSKLNERASSLEQQMSANQAHAADTLRIDQNRLAALEKWLAMQAEQFGRFDPVLHELHDELVSAHQRLAALESAGMMETLDQHEQRLSEAAQHLHDQSNIVGKIQQTLEQLAAQTPAAATLNRRLIGALAAAGAIIIVLLITLIAR